MIARQEWFTRRKYTGWGLSPKTWQGWVYVLGFVAIVMGIQAVALEDIWKTRITLVLVVWLLIDVFTAMASIKLDERERENEAIAERNASWTMVSTIAVMIIGTIMLGQRMSVEYFTMFMAMPLITGVVAKGLTHYLLNK